MGLVSKTIPGLYNGVSQQAPTLRLETQVAEQVNMVGSLVKGMHKRPNSEHIATLLSSASLTSKVHVVNRDESERYVVILNDGSIEVYDTSGHQHTVKYGYVDIGNNYKFSEDLSVQAYISGVNPSHDMVLMSAGDYTFVLNKKKVVAMTGDASPGPTVGTVQQFSDLTDPDYTTPSEGSIVAVEGDPEAKAPKYHLKYMNTDVYEECAAPNVRIRFNATTMPHGLLRLPNGTFAFTRFKWADREVGDDLTNPIPSFVGNPISHIALHRNRLLLLSRDNVICSRASKYWNFWCSTVLDQLDNDPIDLSAASRTVSYLHKAVAHGKNMVLFSGQQQFNFHSGQQILTPKTAKIDATTTFETNAHSSAITAGSAAFFVSPKGKYASILEYNIQPDSLIEDAADITAHCPEYVPNGDISMEAFTTLNTIAIHSTAKRGSLWIYCYYWAGGTKVQSAWSEWQLDEGAEVIGIGSAQSVLYMVVRRGGVITLEAIGLDDRKTPGLDFRASLDRLAQLESSAYDADTYTAKITLPYEMDVTVIKRSNGREVPCTRSGKVVTIKGVSGPDTYYVGVPYPSHFTLSPWYVKNSKDASVMEGRLQVRNLTVIYKDSGFFNIEIANPGRLPRNCEWTSNILGLARIGATNLASGKHKVGIRGQADKVKIKISSNSYLPAVFEGISYEGSLTQRASVL